MFSIVSSYVTCESIQVRFVCIPVQFGFIRNTGGSIVVIIASSKHLHDSKVKDHNFHKSLHA